MNVTLVEFFRLIMSKFLMKLKIRFKKSSVSKICLGSQYNAIALSLNQLECIN